MQKILTVIQLPINKKTTTKWNKQPTFKSNNSQLTIDNAITITIKLKIAITIRNNKTNIKIIIITIMLTKTEITVIAIITK